ncbi:MAG: hypothetical protein WBB29_11210 [Geitlerinemataceae cyanobacterium]
MTHPNTATHETIPVERHDLDLDLLWGCFDTIQSRDNLMYLRSATATDRSGFDNVIGHPVGE